MTNSKPPTSAYELSGASAGKEGLHSVLTQLALAPDQRYFAPLLPDLAGSSEHCSFLHCDGAGTKGIISYLVYKATGDTSVFRGLAHDALVMNLDDILCLGKPESLQLANFVSRNFSRISDAILHQVLLGYQEAAETFKQLGIEITLAGGETADVGDIVQTILVDAVMSGRIRRADLINQERISAGDLVVGFSSAGQCSYETRPNSGLSCNGVSLARHSLLRHDYTELYPEIVDPEKKAHAYRGPFTVSDTVEGLNMTIGEALTSPTRSFAPLLLQLYQKMGPDIHGAVHLTGGAHSKALRFLKDVAVIKNSLPPPPKIFQLIQKHGDVTTEEMYKVFNMGVRLELYVPDGLAHAVVAEAEKFKIDAWVVGRVERSSSRRIELQLPNEKVVYSL